MHYTLKTDRNAIAYPTMAAAERMLAWDLKQRELAGTTESDHRIQPEDCTAQCSESLHYPNKD